MVDYSEDLRYANQRLRGSITYVGEDLSFIEDINEEDGTVHYRPLLMFNWDAMDGQEWLLADFSEVDTSPPELGFMNLPNKAVYISRIPARQFRQGVDLRFLGIDRESPAQLAAFEACVANYYPSLDKVLERVYNEEVESCAFSKQFAVTKGMGVTYKGFNTVIGTVDLDKKVIKLNKAFKFLEESLMEVLA